MDRPERSASTWSARLVESTLRLCVDFPRLTISVILLLTVWAIFQLPKITTDTDPENMLEPDAPVRVSHEATKRTFGIHELIVVGFESERDLFNVDDLTKLFRINHEILNIKGVIIPNVPSLVTTDTMRKSWGHPGDQEAFGTPTADARGRSAAQGYPAWKSALPGKAAYFPGWATGGLLHPD